MRLHQVRVLGPGGLSMPHTVEVNAEGAHDRDATGLVLSPGWMDLHAHLRDPGFPQKETLLSGATSAAVGGFTHVLAMANTDPVTDSPQRLQSLVARTEALPIRISFVGAVTVALEGQVLTDPAALKAAGAVALSDDGRHTMTGVVLRRALAVAAEATIPLHGGFPARFVIFRDWMGGTPIAVIVGKPDFAQPVPVRLHSACLTGDVFGSRRCDCGDQLRLALARLQDLGGGVYRFRVELSGGGFYSYTVLVGDRIAGHGTVYSIPR